MSTETKTKGKSKIKTVIGYASFLIIVLLAVLFVVSGSYSYDGENRAHIVVFSEDEVNVVIDSTTNAASSAAKTTWSVTTDVYDSASSAVSEMLKDDPEPGVSETAK